MLSKECYLQSQPAFRSGQESTRRFAAAEQIVEWIVDRPCETVSQPFCIVLFGSVAKGRARHYSDIDMCFVSPPVISWENIKDLYWQSNLLTDDVKTSVNRALDEFKGCPIPIHRVYVPHTVYFMRYPARDFYLNERVIENIHKFGVVLFKRDLVVNNSH